jgi:glutathione S-transferase
VNLQLFGHPFSSYTMKALIALYENETPFDFRILDPDHRENTAELIRRWPVARFPLLVDDGTTVFETSAIIEHLATFHPGPVPLIPADPKAAVPVRMLDRVFDSHVMGHMQTIVFDARRPEEACDLYGVSEARTALNTIYAWLDQTLAGRRWAAGDAFTMADAAAAPALFYADWAHPKAYPVHSGPSKCSVWARGVHRFDAVAAPLRGLSRWMMSQ